MLFGRRDEGSPKQTSQATLPPFHPQTNLFAFGDGEYYTIEDSCSGTAITGNSGSGKTSTGAAALGMAFLANGYGMLIPMAKKADLDQWLQWIRFTNREKDVRIVDQDGTYTFNFLDYEVTHGGGITSNIVAMMDEIAPMIGGDGGEKSEGGGDNQFWTDSLHLLHVNLVDLVQFARLPLTMELMADIVDSVATSPAESEDPEWQKTSICAAMIREAELRTAEANDPEELADFEQCRRYFEDQLPKLSDKTKSIILLTFSMMAKPFLSRPLRKLLCGETNLTPKDILDGKIVIINLPIAEMHNVGRACSIIWKYCLQRDVLRRPRPPKGTYLRPVGLFCDEAQHIITRSDASYQGVARSQAGATVYMTQSKQAFGLALGNENAVLTLLANLSTRFMFQATDLTAEYCSKLLGEHYVWVETTNQGVGGKEAQANVGSSWTQQKRNYLEPSEFVTLKRGGYSYDRKVECVVYKGGHLFWKQMSDAQGNQWAEKVPYKIITLEQPSNSG